MSRYNPRSFRLHVAGGRTVCSRSRVRGGYGPQLGSGGSSGPLPYEYGDRRLSTTLLPFRDLVDQSSAPSDFNDSAVVYADVVTETEARVLETELKARFKRRRYERGHWDSVIVKYKEVELLDDPSKPPEIATVFDRIRSLLIANHLQSSQRTHWLPCHAIDLHAEGLLNAHVDSVRFSGLLVAGLSLLSPAIMRLKPSSDAQDDWRQGPMEGHVDLLLPPRSLYCLSKVSRFRYSHEILPSGATFKDKEITRDHRLSIIFRDTKEES